jgi:hypothetical protein
MHTRPPSADPQGAPDRDSAYNVRSVPIRLYLPEGPVLQDLAPPILEDGGYFPYSWARLLRSSLCPEAALRGLGCTC